VQAPPVDAGEETGPARRGSRVGRLTVQGWIHAVLVANVLLVIVCGVAGGLLQQRADERAQDLSDRIQPLASSLYRLETSLVDQETGVRGYVLSGDTAFLEPYTAGQRDGDDRYAGVTARIGDDPRLRADLRAIRTAIQDWRTHQAEPLIAAARRGEKVSEAKLRASKDTFDVARGRFTRMERDVADLRARTHASVDDTRRLRDVALLVLLAGFVAGCVALTVLLRRIVVRPLATLEAASAEVSTGAFDQAIRLDGPRDLQSLATAVEAMRRRIVAELSASRSRAALLEARTAELDEQTLELKRSNAELEQFAYVASHDLQEPLRKVASFCQLLEKRYGDQLDDRAKQYIAFAVDGAKRMQVLINDLLTFSRVGRVGDEQAEVALDEVLDGALANLSTSIEEAAASVERPASLPTVCGDPNTLTMLWQNLIGNAVKFRSPGRPCRVAVSVERTDDMWRLCVRDNGIGIDPEFQEKVFIIFQRLHSRDEYEGTGIGLALCRKIVEHHGGQITLDDTVDEGTRVCFTLPVHPRDITANEPDAAPHDPEGAPA
jgi:signal transduction histidine kinase